MADPIITSDLDAAPAALTMHKALNDAAFVHHAIRAVLDQLRDKVYADSDRTMWGIYEAMDASVERLDRVVARGPVTAGEQ